MLSIDEWKRLKTNSSQEVKEEAGTEMAQNSSQDKQHRQIVVATKEENREKVESLLQHLRGKFFWNSSGEIIVNDKAVEGSNIIELLNHATGSDSKSSPVGITQFYNLLKERDVPQEFIKSEERVVGEQRGGEDAASSPPLPKKVKMDTSGGESSGEQATGEQATGEQPTASVVNRKRKRAVKPKPKWIVIEDELDYE